MRAWRFWNFETAWVLERKYCIPLAWEQDFPRSDARKGEGDYVSISASRESCARALAVAGLVGAESVFCRRGRRWAYRYSSPVPLTTVSRIDLIGRLGHLADTLPPGDADVMRAQLRADEEKIVAARADVRLSRDDVRRSLRAEPFDADAMRKAMTANHTAHERFDQVIHDMLASAASKMSVVGRTKLADWPSQAAAARPMQ